MGTGKSIGIPTSMPAISYTAYTAHAAGAVGVTSAAATDLDTTAAALATLSSKFNTLLTQLRENGLLES